MAQFDTIVVGDAQNGGLDQEVARPARLGCQPAEETGAFRQFGEEMTIVILEPMVVWTPQAYPVSLVLSLRAKRGNLVGARNPTAGTRSPRRCAPRDDKLGTREVGTLIDVLDGVEHADGDQFAYGEPSLGTGRLPREGIAYLAVEFSDKISNVHEVPCCRGLSAHSIWEPRDILKIVSNQHQRFIFRQLCNAQQFQNACMMRVFSSRQQ